MGLRWLRDRTTADALARDHGVSWATAYRNLDDVIIVLADQAPDLRRALQRAKAGAISIRQLSPAAVSYPRSTTVMSAAGVLAWWVPPEVGRRCAGVRADG
jgi:hypothetical protein